MKLAIILMLLFLIACAPAPEPAAPAPVTPPEPVVVEEAPPDLETADQVFEQINVEFDALE